MRQSNGDGILALPGTPQNGSADWNRNWSRHWQSSPKREWNRQLAVVLFSCQLCISCAAKLLCRYFTAKLLCRN